MSDIEKERLYVKNKFLVVYNEVINLRRIILLYLQTQMHGLQIRYIRRYNASPL